MEVDGEPSASEPTFTPPGSLPRVEDLPVEQQELQDIDFDLLEQQQFDVQQQQQQLDDTARGSWADQQDQPEGLDPNVDLIDLGGDGAATGAPLEDNPEPVVEGPPNYNIFHGESPPRLIETKQEEVASGVAPSAPAIQPAFVKKEEQVEEPAPVDPIGVVDYDPDDEELEEEPAPVEGAAPSAPSRGPPEEEFRQVRRRGTRGGRDERNKSFKRQFHQVGFPSAKRWVRDYTTHACGESFELNQIYLTDTPDFTPVVRFVGQFEEEDANADPILAIARFIRYVPSLKSFLNNRCPGLLQRVYQRNRELYQEHKDRPFGSNPLDYFEHPQRNRGEPIRPDHQGVGAQFHRDLLAGKYPDLVVHQEQQAAEEGPPSSGWRPSLRLPVQPSEPPPDRPPDPQGRSNPVQRIPSPPNYIPCSFCSGVCFTSRVLVLCPCCRLRKHQKWSYCNSCCGGNCMLLLAMALALSKPMLVLAMCCLKVSKSESISQWQLQLPFPKIWAT